MPRALILTLTHLGVAALGFVIGIYTLPILMAPAAPDVGDVDPMLERVDP